MSMSKTVGATVHPVANDLPVTPMLSKPVFPYLHSPLGSGEPWSWYCHRELTEGFQQFPDDRSHGTGFGSSAARAGPDPEAGTAVRPKARRPTDRSRIRRLTLT